MDTSTPWKQWVTSAIPTPCPTSISLFTTAGNQRSLWRKCGPDSRNGPDSVRDGIERCNFSRQFFQQLIESRTIFLLHLDEGHGHAVAGLDILDDHSGTHFAARNIEHNL